MDIIIMSNIEFPNAAWTQRYSTGGDLIESDTPIGPTTNLYKNCTNVVIDVKGDYTNFATAYNAGAGFCNSSNAVIIIMFPDDFAPKSCNSMFGACSKLIIGPEVNTTNVTTANYVFQNCSKMITIPQYDTSKATDMQYMFGGCAKMRSVPALDASSATNVNSIFADGTNYRLMHIGGLINLGKQSTLNGTSSGFLSYLPNLTKESIMNVINNLYDRAAAGFSVKTIKMHANHLAALTDEEKAIATNKGWTLS